MTKKVRLLFRNTHRLYRFAKKTKMSLILMNTATHVGLQKSWRKARSIYNARVYAKNILNPAGKSAALWKII